MCWNYRLMALPTGFDGATIYAFHEVYYDDSGGPRGYIEAESAPRGETLEELATSLTRMQEALAKPMLVPTDFSVEAT